MYKGSRKLIIKFVAKQLWFRITYEIFVIVTLVTVGFELAFALAPEDEGLPERNKTAIAE